MSNASLLIVNLSLFPFDILEHILVLREYNIIGKDLGVLLVELEDFGQPDADFILCVRSFEELRDVINDQIVLKDGNNMGALIVDYIIYNFHIVEIITGHVFSQVLLDQSSR